MFGTIVKATAVTTLFLALAAPCKVAAANPPQQVDKYVSDDAEDEHLWGPAHDLNPAAVIGFLNMLYPKASASPATKAESAILQIPGEQTSRFKCKAALVTSNCFGDLC